MDSSKLANWLQIGANLGILAGLILVGLQIKQSTDITRAEITHQLWTSGNQMQLTLLGEDGSEILAKAQRNPEALTDGEIEAVVHWTWYWNNVDRNAENQWRQGLLQLSVDEMNLLHKTRAATVYMHNPVSREAWEVMKEGGLNYEWMKVVDAEISRLEQAGFRGDQWFDRFRKAAGQANPVRE